LKIGIYKNTENEPHEKKTEMIQKYAATLKDRHLYFKKCKFSHEILKKKFL